MSETPVTDHAHTEASDALPSTVDDEGEAADQALSADAVEAAKHEPPEGGAA
jgi:hypothetical protein